MPEASGQVGGGARSSHMISQMLDVPSIPQVQGHLANAGYFPVLSGGGNPNYPLNMSQHTLATHHQSQQYHPSQQAQLEAKQRQEQDQVNIMRIQDDMNSLCHMDRMMGGHSNYNSLYKKIMRTQARTKEALRTMPGSRDIRKEEPPKQIAHRDFLLREIQDMALDFSEETYQKRYILAKLAYEAQDKAIQIMARKAKFAQQKNDIGYEAENREENLNNLQKRQSPMKKETRNDDQIIGFNEINSHKKNYDQLQLQLVPERTDPLILKEDPLAILNINSPNGSITSLFGPAGGDPMHHNPVAMDLEDFLNLGDDKINDNGFGRNFNQIKGLQLLNSSDQRVEEKNIIMELGAYSNIPKDPFESDGDDDKNKQNDWLPSLPIQNSQLQERILELAKNEAFEDFQEEMKQNISNDLNFQIQLNDNIPSKKGSNLESSVKEDILDTETAIIRDLGINSVEDVKKRSKKFKQMMEESQIPKPIIKFNKKNKEKDFEIMLDKDLFEIQNKHIDQNQGIFKQCGGLYKTQVISLINEIYSDRYNALEQKRKVVEEDFEKSHALKYLDKDYDFGFNGNNLLKYQYDQEKLQIPQLATIKLETGPQTQIDSESYLIGENTFPRLRDNFKPQEKPDWMRPDIPAHLFRPDQLKEIKQELHENNKIIKKEINESEDLNKKLNLVIHQKEQQGYQNHQTQIELVVHQDVFNFCDELMDETTHTSYSRKLGSPNHIQLELLTEKRKEKKNQRLLTLGEPNENQSNDSEHELKVRAQVEDSEGSVDDFEKQSYNPEIKDEKQKARILTKMRDNDDFKKQVCNKLDREMMRLFPNITDQSYYLLVLDIYARKKHLDGFGALMDDIAEKYNMLIKSERQYDSRQSQKIQDLRDAISRDVTKIWNNQKEYDKTRESQARELCLKIRNVYNNQPQIIRKLNDEKRKNINRKSQNFNESEVSFMRWYVSIFGDNWRLISNVMRYHPFIRGYLRSKESVQEQFIQYTNTVTNTTLLNDQYPIKPWRTTQRPILITERPPSLYCLIKQVNQMHHLKIKSIQYQIANSKFKRVFRFALVPNQANSFSLQLEQVGTTSKQNTQVLQIQNKVGKKRQRSGQQGQVWEENEDDLGFKNQQEKEERLRQDEEEEKKTLIDEYGITPFSASGGAQFDVYKMLQFDEQTFLNQSEEEYLKNYYLGQSVNDVVEGDLKMPPPLFNFRQCHDRRISYSRIKPLVALQRRQIQQTNVQDDIRFQSGSIAGGASGKVRGKSTTPLIPNSGHLFTQAAQNRENDRLLDDEDQKMDVSEEEMNTPMYCALFELKGNGKNIYVKSVQHQAGLMFWLSYLYRKIYQNSNVSQLLFMITHGKQNLRQQMVSLAQQINYLHLREAHQVRKASEQYQLNDSSFISHEEQKQYTYKENLKNDLQTYIADVSLGLYKEARKPIYENESLPEDYEIEQVKDLWSNHESIFYFDEKPETLKSQLDQETSSERQGRKLDSIIDMMTEKWDRMDRYWFQKNRFLDHKMRQRGYQKDNVVNTLPGLPNQTVPLDGFEQRPVAASLRPGVLGNLQIGGTSEITQATAMYSGPSGQASRIGTRDTREMSFEIEQESQDQYNQSRFANGRE